MQFVLRTRDGYLDQADEGTFASLVGALADRRKVLIHLHGGLVSQSSGEEIATRLGAGAAQGGYNAGDWLQIFPVWRTGLVETVETNWRELLERRLVELSGDRLFNLLVDKIGKRLLGSLGAGAAGRGATASGFAAPLEDSRTGDPFADLDTLLAAEREQSSRDATQATEDVAILEALRFSLEQDAEVTRVAQDLAAAAAERSPVVARAFIGGGDAATGETMLQRINPNQRAVLVNDATSIGGARFIVSTAGLVKFVAAHGAAIAARVLRRFRSGRDHGAYCTIVEEVLRELYGDHIGGAIWGFMKQDAVDHFQPGRFGDRLLAALKEANPSRIVVVGHSAGSILASHLLTAAANRRLRGPIDLALLAPAVRMSLFAQALATAGHLIGRFRLFAMHDELERQDRLIAAAPRLYPRSLLYIVSGLFEGSAGEPMADAPLLGMERFLTMPTSRIDDLTERDALTSVLQFLSAEENGVVYSKTADGAGNGLRSSCTSHGGFDDDADTIASVSTYFAVS